MSSQNAYVGVDPNGNRWQVPPSNTPSEAARLEKDAPLEWGVMSEVIEIPTVEVLADPEPELVGELDSNVASVPESAIEASVGLEGSSADPESEKHDDEKTDAGLLGGNL